MEEIKEGISTLKKTILGVVTTAITAAGVYISTHINELFGVEEETKAEVEQVEQTIQQPAPIIVNIENNNQQTQTTQPTRVIERVVEKPVVQEEPKKEEPKEETTQERMARLKKQREEQNGK